MVGVIYTDAFMREKGFLPWCAGDFVIGKQNDFCLKVPVMDELVQNCYLMIDGMEYGGVIDKIILDTSLTYMEVLGRTWHGILQNRIVEPPAGQSHYTVSGEANEVIGEVLEKLGLGFCMAASNAASGFTVSSFTFDRYVDGYTGLCKMLAPLGARLAIAYSGELRRAVVSAVPRGDYRSDGIDGDKVPFTMSVSRPVNHLIALGQGEGAARQVVHVYADARGVVSRTQTLTGIAEKADTYENTNADDDEDLYEDAAKRLREMQDGIESCQLNGAEESSYCVGDIVGATYAPRQKSITAVVVQKQAVISSSGEFTFKTKTEAIGE